MKSRLPSYPVITIIIILLLVAGCEYLDAQEFTVKNFTVQDGLSHNNIRAIVRDSTGFLWVATWDGLSRFDGYNFKNYFHVPNDTTSLNYFSVRQITVDGNNNLWVFTDLKLLQKYNRISDNFINIRNIEGVKLDNISLIDTDSDGELILINGNKIIKWNDKNSKGKVWDLNNADGKVFIPEESFVYCIAFIGNELWIAGKKVSLFKKKSETKYVFERDFTIADILKRKFYFDYNEWGRLYISEKGNKWLFSNRAIFRLDEKPGMFTPQKPDNIPLDEFKGKDSFFWGDFYNGIYIYETKSSELRHIPSLQTGLPNAIMPDKDNTLWFSGTSPGGVPKGLCHVVFSTGFFKNYLITAPDSTQPAVYAIAIDNKKGTWLGIREYDEIVVVDSTGKRNTIGRISGELSNSVGHIRSMGLTTDGIWVGNFLNYLRFYNFRDCRFTGYFPGTDACRTILPLDNKVYIATRDIYAFDPSTGKTETIWRSNTNLSTYRLFPDSGKILWGAMAKGTISRVNISTGEGRTIIIPPGHSNTEDIIKDRNGNLWLAFLGDGVCRFDPEKETTKFYTTQNGLSNNTTYNLLEDRSGNIWVSTDNGISMINQETDKIRTFGLSDGLKIHEFNSGAKFRTDDGEFLFGGMGGFVRFYPDSLSSLENHIEKQKIILTGLNVSGVQKSLLKSLNESDTITLNPGENNFNIGFSSDDFKNSENIRYRYRLSGVNTDWIETDSYNRNLNYSNLRPGFHILLIEANDMNGKWAASKKVTIRIMPYFFQTRVFLIAMPAFVAALLVFLIIIYIRQVRTKERQKQEALRLQALQGQMNPHFIFNSLNSINYFISNNDKLSANRYIADFARLIRSILHNMNYSYITLEKEFESVEEYLKIEYLRFGDKFDFKVLVDSDLRSDEIKVPPGMVQPFVENAIWHGVRGLEHRKGNISVKFGLRDGRLVCEIEDDGIGRKRSNEMKSKIDQKKSRGISIIVERLRILSNLNNDNYKVVIDDLYPERAETGTRVVIDLPLERI